jgi:hypothetical protein
MHLPNHPLLQHALICLIAIFVGIALVVGRVHAIDYTVCPGTLTNVVFGSSTFSLSAGCALTIDGGTADNLDFTTAHTDLVLVVKNLDCGSTASPGSCITFSSTLTGGSIDISGASWSIGPGAVTTGNYIAVRFVGAVSGTDISIVGVQLTLNSVTCTGGLGVFAVYATGNFAGKNTAGSTFNVSSTRITGSAFSSGGQLELCAATLTGQLRRTTRFSLRENRVVRQRLFGRGDLLGELCSSVLLRGC